MKKPLIILLSLLLLLVLGYLYFIWGKLPGQYDPTRLDGKGIASGDRFVCGGYFKSPMLIECDGWKFFHDSTRLYAFIAAYLPLLMIAGLFAAPFLLLFDRHLWPAGIFVWVVLLNIAYLFYRRYKRKHSPEPSVHDPSSHKHKA